MERIPILKMGKYLLVSIQVDMHDRLAMQLQEDLTSRIAETGASSPKDMGKVMKAVMPKLAGKNVDGKAVNESVRRTLGG